MLLTSEVIITLNSANIKHYEDLGYKIPRTIDKYGRKKIKKGTKMLVSINDLPQNSFYKVIYQCDCCKDIFECTYQSYTKVLNKQKQRDDKNYYCQPCANKIFQSSENSNLYNPNLTKEEREDSQKRNRNYPQLYQVVKECFKRDNYTCQVCNKRGNGNLNAHHLNNWNNYPEQRFDLENLITLCENCHKTFHKFMGKSNIPCTKDDFNNWFNNIKKN